MATPSMLIVPDRYKSGVLYSQLPESGAVDFDVTRATTAYRTNASGVLESVASGVPRLDYSAAGGCPALLVEPAATNLALQSNTFSTTWTQTGVTLTSGQVGYNGTNNAWSLIATATTSAHRIVQVVSTPNNISATYSVFAKANGYNFLRLRENTTTALNAIFNLSTGVVVSNTGARASIENVGDGWYRCNYTISPHGGANGFEIGAQEDSTNVSFLGNGTSGILIQNSQMEVSDFGATSYIPTTTATATRNADVISKTSVSGFIGQSQGTLYAEINVDKLLGIQSRYIFNISDGTADNRIYLAFSGASSNILRARVWSGGVLQATIDTTTISTLGIRKLAIGYANNDVVFYVNGVQIGTDNSASIPACSQVNLGSSQGNVAQFNDRIRAAAIYTTRLSNTELASLTSL
jgi:hypothetical protein